MFVVTHSHDLPIRNVTQNFKCLIMLCSFYSFFFQFLACGLWFFSVFVSSDFDQINFGVVVGRGGLWWLVIDHGGLCDSYDVLHLTSAEARNFGPSIRASKRHSRSSV